MRWIENWEGGEGPNFGRSRSACITEFTVGKEFTVRKEFTVQ